MERSMLDQAALRVDRRDYPRFPSVTVDRTVDFEGILRALDTKGLPSASLPA
ncbi:MAG: hypothetical protein M2R45_02023 [Verrucomicrobia subdivision 3 bacterium]|nr:hypothetical protein [Limisphaerales bacterium]MCS1414842.1 hypothetical protein [Limisphaerales bacterium]